MHARLCCRHCHHWNTKAFQLAEAKGHCLALPPVPDATEGENYGRGIFPITTHDTPACAALSLKNESLNP